VKGHITAALDLEQLDTLRREKVRTRDEILLLRGSSERYNRRVLDEEENILRDLTADSFRRDAALKVERLAI
jgi:hypothetical protein